MNYVRAFIDNTTYTVVDPDQYLAHTDIYPINTTAIRLNGRIVPLRNRTDTRPGYYQDGPLFVIKGDIDRYREENILVFDLGNIKDVNELMNTETKIRDLNKGLLECSEDNVYVAPYFDDDTPEMKMFKSALEKKHIDVKIYSDKIEKATGGSYNNNVRLLYKSNMTIDKMKRLADAFDMRIELAFSDKSPNVANPIGETISGVINNEEEV